MALSLLFISFASFVASIEPINDCLGQPCMYIIEITFDISYSFLNGTSVDIIVFAATAQGTMSNILNQWIPYEHNIEINVDLSNFTDGEDTKNDQLDIESIIGIEDDTVYNSIKDAYDNNAITNDLTTDLFTSINSLYNTSGFSVIQPVISEFNILNSTLDDNVNTKNDDDELKLYGFIYFDIGHYSLYDWICLCGVVILLFLCCFFCGCYYHKRQERKVPNSEISKKTGSDVDIEGFNKWKYVSNRDNNGTVSALFDVEQGDRKKNSVKGSDAVWTPQYEASPMKRDFNTALNGVVEKKRESKKFGIQISHLGINDGLGMHCKSDNNNLLQMHQINENVYDEEDCEENDSFKHKVPAPPPISGSMVDRMNHNNYYNVSGAFVE